MLLFIFFFFFFFQAEDGIRDADVTGVQTCALPIFAERATDTDCSDGAGHWGGTLEVKNTGETANFEVFDCDNGEPGVGHDGFGIRAFPVNGQLYEVLCPDESLPPAEPSCTLTGGNRQFHPTH